MANQVAARLQGDDYQHLYTWFHVLRLLKLKEMVATVVVEDSDAGSIDDVTIQHEPDSSFPDSYHQVKYHVDHRATYSVTSLTEQEKNGASLLRKWHRSWKKLIDYRPNSNVEVHIITTWTWAEDDGLGALVSGQTSALKDDFFSATEESKTGKQRQRIYSHLNGEKEEIERFMRSLRFKFGYGCWNELEKMTAERMEFLKLKFEHTDLLTSVSLVRKWVKDGRQKINRARLEEEIKTYNLALPPEIERAVHIYLTTIKAQKFDFMPDYVIDWRDYFEGSDVKKGHDLKNPEDWNKELLPQLHAMEARINAETDCRLIKARGLARLSAWIAFGYTFSEVNRYQIEVAQGSELWRTDAIPNSDFGLSQNGPHGEQINTDGRTVAVGISVTGALDEDVRAHVKLFGEPVKALLLLRPERELGPGCLRDASDVLAMAQATKSVVRTLVKHYGATRLLLYYFGPLSGACFLGHQFNAVCNEIVVMERSDPSYAASFVLS